MKEEENSKLSKIKLFWKSLQAASISTLSTLNLLLTLAYFLLLIMSLYFAFEIFLNGFAETNLGLMFCSVIPILLITVLTYLFNRYINWFYKWAKDQI